MTKSGDACEDLIGRLGPHERLGLLVRHHDIVAERRLQGSCTGMRPALDLLLSQGGEPPLPEVEPRGTRRREVQVEAQAFRQPRPNQRRLVGAIVVENEMDGATSLLRPVRTGLNTVAASRTG